MDIISLPSSGFIGDSEPIVKPFQNDYDIVITKVNMHIKSKHDVKGAYECNHIESR